MIYDPGMSGSAKGVADKVAGDLQEKGYTVTLAGVKSSAAYTTTGYRHHSGWRASLCQVH